MNTTIVQQLVLVLTAVAACSSEPASSADASPGSCPTGKRWHFELKKCIPDKGVIMPATAGPDASSPSQGGSEPVNKPPAEDVPESPTEAPKR